MTTATIYDWDKGTVREHYGETFQYIMPLSERLMDDAEKCCILVDEATGEHLHRVLAYDAGRELVERVLLDENCNPFMNPGWNRVATVIEKRRCRIIPGRLAIADKVQPR